MSFLNGSTAEVAEALLNGAGRAVELTLSLLGVMSLWNGVMAVLKEAGAIKMLSKLFYPIMRLIFDNPTNEATACLTANLLGIGNAATPLGIAALKKFQGNSSIITKDGIMLSALCCSNFSIIPTTVLALRKASGAKYIFELLPTVWAVGLIGMICSIIIVKFLWRLFYRRDN